MSSRAPAATIDPGQAGAFVALCAGAIAMGVSPVFVRFAAADIGPFASAFWRVALALPVLYAWMRIDEARAPGRPKRSFTKATVFAGLAFVGDLFFWHLAILNTTVANATFFATTAPIFVILITWLVLREHVARAIFAGLGLCLLGGFALIGQSMQVAPERVVGDLYGVATAFFFALYFLGVEKARRQGGSAARVTFELSLVTAAGLFLIAMALEPKVIPTTREGVLALVALGLISHAGGQGLLAVALGRLPAMFSSLVIFLEAVAAALFGWLILSEALTLVQAAGGAMILMGIWIARPRRVKPI